MPNARGTLRRRSLGLLLLLALCALTLVLAACGVPANGIASGSPTATQGGTPVSSVPPTSAVTLVNDRSSYTPSSAITVMLTNHRATSIFTFDHQTSCTILTLERQTTGGWETTGGCAMGRPTQRVEIKAGETVKILLAPDAGQIHAAPWPAGTYRVVLRYTLQTGDTATGTTAASPTFSIG